MELDREPLHTYRGFVVKFPDTPPTHQPMRPSWTCSHCSEEWPCQPAHVQLMAEADTPTHLAVMMWNYLEAYAFDVGEGPLMGAFQRFIGWTR